MKKMFLLLPAAFLLLFDSCKDDEVPTPAYERFTGKWNVTEMCGTHTYEYELMIGAGFADDKIIFLYNLSNLGYAFGVDATIASDSLSFIIPEQQVSGYTISGSGYVVGENDSLYFQWTGGPHGSCSAGARFSDQ